MADYKGIKGFKVQSLASDPTLVEGQVWYNTAGFALKYLGVAAGAWASSTALNTARMYMAASSSGSVTSALVIGGTPVAPTELWNGSSWTEIVDPTAPRSKASGIGTATALVLAGGDAVSPPPAAVDTVELWNGTAWSEVNDLNDTRYNMGEFGTSTAAVIAGGQSPGATNVCETWDGTCWTETNDLNTPAFELAGAGTSGTAGIMFGGRGVANTESWNGTSWTEVNNLNTGRADLGGSGSSTAALGYGGAPSTGKTEEWDGTSWTEVADLGTGRYASQGIGSGTSEAMWAGGNVPPITAVVEEWNGVPLSVKTVTVS